jgi:hypothetical protein
MRKIRMLLERIKFEWNYTQAVIEYNDDMTRARRELAAK